MNDVTDNRPKVKIYTDGSCLGNPGAGGWACLLIYKGKEKVLSGKQADTTNNQMELTAVIKALKALTKSCQVELYTDSKYVINGATQWLQGWEKNNWKNSKKQPVKNQLLWQQLSDLMKPHDIDWHWVKGHAGHDQNERVDAIAREQAEQII